MAAPSVIFNLYIFLSLFYFAGDDVKPVHLCYVQLISIVLLLSSLILSRMLDAGRPYNGSGDANATLRRLQETVLDNTTVSTVSECFKRCTDRYPLCVGQNIILQPDRTTYRCVLITLSARFMSPNDTLTGFLVFTALYVSHYNKQMP